MSANQALSCCGTIDTCDISDAYFRKSVYSPAYYAAPAITIFILCLIYITLATLFLLNTVKIIYRWREYQTKRYFLIISILLFLMAIGKFIVVFLT